MDRALKERVIGAAVLVVIAVLIVPIFLDGPSPDSENVQESITLPGQDGESVKQKTIVLDRDRDQPVPAPLEGDEPKAEEPETEQPKAEEPKAEPDKVVTQVKEEAPAVAKPEPKKTPADPAAAAQSSTGMWAVQLGSFSSQENAERLAADLRKQGYAAFLSQLQTSSGKLHRVRVGPQKNRAEAESVASKLSAKGHKGQVVPHP